jgi:hypothetical protein
MNLLDTEAGAMLHFRKKKTYTKGKIQRRNTCHFGRGTTKRNFLLCAVLRTPLADTAKEKAAKLICSKP